MESHSSILAWRISWTDKPGELHFMGSQRVGHDRATFTYLLTSSRHSLIDTPQIIFNQTPRYPRPSQVDTENQPPQASSKAVCVNYQKRERSL